MYQHHHQQQQSSEGWGIAFILMLWQHALVMSSPFFFFLFQLFFRTQHNSTQDNTTRRAVTTSGVKIVAVCCPSSQLVAMVSADAFSRAQKVQIRLTSVWNYLIKCASFNAPPFLFAVWYWKTFFLWGRGGKDLSNDVYIKVKMFKTRKRRLLH